MSTQKILSAKSLATGNRSAAENCQPSAAVWGDYQSQTSEAGVNRLGILVFTLLIALGVLVGSQVIPFYYYYYEVLGLMEAQAKVAQDHTDVQIREMLIEKIRKLEIPIDNEEELKINRFNGKIVIELEYEEILYLDLGDERVYDLHVFEFNPRVERQY